MFFSSSTRMTRMLCIGISVAVTVTFRRNPTEFYSANIPNFSCVSVLLFQVCIHACRKPRGLPPSKEGVRTMGTGHCKYKICSRADLSLMKLGKTSSRAALGALPHVEVCASVCLQRDDGEERSGREDLPLRPTGSSHTKAKIQLYHISMGPASEPKSLQRSRTVTAAAAGRGAVKPAHQGRVFCSCRNLDRALAGRTPCPTPHTEQMLLHFGKKRSGERKPNSPRGGSASHPLP